MSTDKNGVIAWLRQWFDDIYAPKGQGGSVTLDDVYPIGSIYMSVNSVNPSTLFGGTWQQLEDTFLYATSETADTGYQATGGEATHTLSINEMPSHAHKPHDWTIVVSKGANSGNYSNPSGKFFKIFKDDANQNRTTGYTGGGAAHNNMPPYMKVYMWKRVQDVKTLTLTADKSILSYCDRDTVILTATLTGGDVANKTVEFFNGATSLGTSITNSNGVATITYTSAGVGDVSFSAEADNGMLVTENFKIEDCLKYDDATSDKSSAFSFLLNPSSSSVSYESTQRYKLNYGYAREANPVKLALVSDFNINDFEIMVDVYYTSSQSKQMTVRVETVSDEWNNHSEIGTWSSSKILRNVVNGTNNQSNPSGALPTSSWITCIFKRQNGTISLEAKYKDGASISTYSSTAYTTTNLQLALQCSESINGIWFKNIKIKPL